MAQLNLRVGDVRGNVARIIAAAAHARDEMQAQVVVFPELALTGYPPEDLLLRSDLRARVLWGVEEMKRSLSGIDVIVGYPHEDDDGCLYNAVALIRNGAIAARYFKQHLPNYGVFDEKRYFTAGKDPCVVDIQGVPVALTICEDTRRTTRRPASTTGRRVGRSCSVARGGALRSASPRLPSSAVRPLSTAVLQTRARGSTRRGPSQTPTEVSMAIDSGGTGTRSRADRGAAADAALIERAAVRAAVDRALDAGAARARAVERAVAAGVRRAVEDERAAGAVHADGPD